MSVTLTLRGDQLGTYQGLSGNGNNADRVVTLTGVSALGSPSDLFTVVVEQVNSGVTQFQNGQFVTIYGPSGNVVMARSGINPDAEQGLAAGDEHLIVTNGASRIVIDLGGVPTGPATVKYTRSDDVADPGVDDDDGELDFDAFPCFARGTRIATDHGEVAVEDLRPGMMLQSEGNALRPIRWIGSRRLVLQPGADTQRPILMRAGSLGAGVPRRDLVVSPQHRICLERSGETSLAPAKGLLDLNGVRWMKGKRAVTYYSVLLDQHAVIYAEGAPVESLYPGPVALKVLGPTLRQQIYALIPGLQEFGVAAYGAPAHPLLTVRQAARRVAAAGRHISGGPAHQEIYA